MVVALTGVTLFSGLATGFGLFYRLVYILGLTTALTYFWNWVSLRSLDVSVDRRTQKANVGDKIEERLTIRNLSGFPKTLLEVEDLSDLPGYTSGLALSLRGKGFRSWRTSTPARRRGVYRMGPVQVANTDAFGMFRRTRDFCGTQTVVVYPRTHDVPEFTIPAAFMSGESSTRKRALDITPHASSIRDYAFGDSISRVHWNSTARLGKLMSKEFDLGLSSEVWLCVDLQDEVQAGELEESTDEYAVSIAASLARRYLEGHLPVGLIAHGDRRYFLPPETGKGQFDRVMEFLAMSRAEGKVSLESVLTQEESLWGYHSSLVIITSSHQSGWVPALRQLSQRRVRLAVVLLDCRSFGGIFNTKGLIPELYIAGVPPYLVCQGDDIPVALRRPYTSPEIGPAAGITDMEARV